MTRFPTAARLVSWAGLTPTARQSGPRKGRGKKGHGNTYAKRICVLAAYAAANTGTFLGERFRRQFEALRAELPGTIREIRIQGAMIGLDLTFDATDLVSECLRRHLLINATHGHVIRLLPALTIGEEQIDEGCAILGDVLRQAAL